VNRSRRKHSLVAFPGGGRPRSPALKRQHPRLQVGQALFRRFLARAGVGGELHRGVQLFAADQFQAADRLVDSGAGHIVNLGSVAGIWSYANGSSYVASKFAVHGYTRALRDDLQGKPVRITNVAPGLVETDFSRVRFHGDEEKARAVYANVAMGGPLHAEDVADSILFALTRPPHVNIDEIVLTALAQTSGGNILRES